LQLLLTYDIVQENASGLCAGETMKEITLITLGVLIGWLIEWIIDWLYWRRKNEECREENRHLKSKVAQLQATTSGKPSKQEKQAELSRPDDFSLITGVGPVIAEMLNGAGITTFEGLAGLSPEKLREILGDLIERLADEEDLLRQAKHFAKEKKLARNSKKNRQGSKGKKSKKGKKKKKSSQDPNNSSNQTGKEKLDG
jgi:predicted flap endonuclease-1-like 5' DNA nuclease